MNVGSLFSGCGLLDLGLCLAGLDHSWLCEVDPFRRELLARRWPGVRIFDDVRAVGSATAERVDVIVGGFPCKGGSTAGKREGFGHPETVLWREMRRVVGELRPRYVVVENVANLLAVCDGDVWAEVLADLASLGFDVVWDCFPAAAFGAPHLRDRVIAIAADPEAVRLEAGRLPERAKASRPESGNNDRDASTNADERRQGKSERYLQGGEFRAGGGVQVAPADAESIRAGEPPDAAHAIAGIGDARCVSARRGREAAADADIQRGWDGRRGEQQRDAERRGLAVEWGEYAPAIRRWAEIRGPAPEPLVRRVDDRRAARVERSRLSALGDGAQVQLGLMVGRHLMGLP